MQRRRSSAVTSVVLAAMAAAPCASAQTPIASPQWEYAVGTTAASDYNFRGISQSARGPSAWGFGELRYNAGEALQFYAALGADTIEFPNRARAEVDLYSGIRSKFGKLSLDLGAWYYAYPFGKTFNGAPPGPAGCANRFVTPTGFCNVVKGDVSFFEAFAKASYALSDQVSVGASLFYAPDWLHSGAPGTYTAGIFKLAAPSSWLPTDWGAYFAGELGRYWFGRTDAFYAVPAFPSGVKYPDYTHWNFGLGVTYKTVTFDLRYYDTTLSAADCNVITSDHTARFDPASVSATNPSGLISRWCGAAVIGKLSVEVAGK